eukprot:Gb_37940 [translate_table: standard]
MEALPIFLDSLVAAWGAVLISVTLILMFGEILPQAICSRYGLAVGAALAPVVRVLLLVFFPVAYPISKVLFHTGCLAYGPIPCRASGLGFQAGMVLTCWLVEDCIVSHIPLVLIIAPRKKRLFLPFHICQVCELPNTPPCKSLTRVPDGFTEVLEKCESSGPK